MDLMYYSRPRRGVDDHDHTRYSSCAQARKTIAELQLAVKRLKGGESTGKDRRAESGSDPSKDPKVIAAVLKANAEK